MANYLATDTDLTAVANAIRTKGGTSEQLEFPQGFLDAIDGISGGGGQTVYTSSTGLLYTPIMTIDLSMERATGFLLKDIMTRYGKMPYLEELTLTGVVRQDYSGSVLSTASQFTAENYPLLKKVSFQPTEIRLNNGNTIDPDDANYQKITAGHYVFSGTNLTELVIGRVGGPYWGGGGYYRRDMPVPPGTINTNTGSLDGLTLKVYVREYDAKGGFMDVPASNTTIICYDYETGEVLTA